MDYKFLIGVTIEPCINVGNETITDFHKFIESAKEFEKKFVENSDENSSGWHHKTKNGLITISKIYLSENKKQKNIVNEFMEDIIKNRNDFYLFVDGGYDVEEFLNSIKNIAEKKYGYIPKTNNNG